MRDRLGAATLAVTVACAAPRGANRASHPLDGRAVDPISLAQAGLDPEAIDPSVSPCDDLYRHACGGWLARFEMPPDRVSYEKTFTAIEDATSAALRTLLEEASASASATDHARQLADFYRGCLDEASVDRRGVEPIAGFLRQIDAAATREQLAEVLGAIHPVIDAFFSFGTRPSPSDPDVLVAWLGRGGARGLPSYGDYTSDDPKSAALRHAYLDHAVRMLRLAGASDEDARAIAADALELQTKLAAAPATSRPAMALDRAGLEREFAGFPWRPFLRAIGVPESGTVLVNDPEFAARASELFAQSRLAQLQRYLRWRVVSDLSPLLGSAFAAERHALTQAIFGAFSPAPRWKTCVDATRATLRDLLAQAYMARFFPRDRIAATRAIFAALGAAFDRRLDEIGWLDPTTRSAAKDKLAAMSEKIAAPEHAAEISFAIDPGKYAENVLGVRLELARQRFARVGASVDRAAWNRNPLETNAFVDHWTNSIVVPAAFLQPPLLGPNQTVAVRFGRIGFHLAHELIHQFDVDGARYDARGGLRDWWSPAVWREFRARAACLQDQFRSYEPLPGVHVDGARTLTETIADLGGLRLAFRAYRAARAGAGTIVRAGSYDEDQQFFVAHAQDFCVRFGADDLRVFLRTNVHPPHWLRINGIVQNLPEFAEAFGCRRPVKTCEVW